MIRTDLKAREELMDALTRLGKIDPKAPRPDPEVIRLLNSVTAKNSGFRESVGEWLDVLDQATDQEGFDSTAREAQLLANALAEILHKTRAYREALGLGAKPRQTATRSN